MGLFSQKKVWHSYLKHASPVTLRFKGPPVLSKYADAGVDQYLAYFEVQGDDTEGYYYFVESEDVLQQLRDTPFGQWVKVTASGDNADTHHLDIRSLSDDEIAESKASGTFHKPKNNNNAPATANYSSGFITEDYLKCVEQAAQIARSEFMETDDPSVVQAIAATLYINWSHTRFSTPLAPSDIEEIDVEEEASEFEQGVLEALDKLVKRTGKAHDGRNLKTTIEKIEKQAASGIDEDAFKQTIKWIAAEVEYQTEDEPDDELPF